MALMRCEIFSQSLSRQVDFITIIPNDLPPFITGANPNFARPTKTVILLHGFSNKCTEWLYFGNLVELAGIYNVNFVLPSGENWFYVDGPQNDRKYMKFIGEELVEYTRKTFGFSDKAEDTIIGGLSMGGFGALHTGLAYPETFSKIIALSSALIIYDIKGMQPGTELPLANYDYYHTVFGNLDEVDKTLFNPERLVDKLIEDNAKIPGIYMAVGTEDFLYQNNQIFRSYLQEKNVEFTYEEGPGVHDFKFWNEYIVKGLEWALK